MFEYEVLEKKDSLLLKKYDQKFLSFANDYDMEEWVTASLIRTDILERCGYFQTMPHQLTMVNQFLTGSLQSETEKNAKGFALTPAACLHIYPQLANTNCQNKIITTFQKVYRVENGKYTNKGRLWEFWVREFVAVGCRDYVKSFLRDFQNQALAYALSEFNSANLVDACDLFFPTRENNLTRKIQLKNSMKKELLVNISDEQVACASFNYHKNHFSRRFNFDNNSTIETACVGFGLNRWILASKQTK